MSCHTPDIYQFEDVKDQKRFLRKRAKAFLKDYCSDKELMKECSLSAFKSVTESPEYKKAPVILAFMAMKDELNIEMIIKKALSDGKKVALPRMRPDSEKEKSLMDFYYIEKLEQVSDDENAYKILEPNESLEKVFEKDLPENTFIFVPALAFNLEGARLGRGKGYYDRFLAKLPEDKQFCICGVCFTICVTKAIPVEENDFFVNHLLTEYGFIKTGRKN